MVYLSHRLWVARVPPMAARPGRIIDAFIVVFQKQRWVGEKG